MKPQIDMEALREELRRIEHNATCFNGALEDDNQERKERESLIEDSTDNIKNMVEEARAEEG